jgi:ankyrin repeat protein
MGDLSLCRLLVEQGNDPSSKEGYFESPLGVAAFSGHVDYFLTQGTSPNLTGTRFGSVLQAAAAGGSVQVVERLIRAGAEVNAKGASSTRRLLRLRLRSMMRLLHCLSSMGLISRLGRGLMGRVCIRRLWLGIRRWLSLY